MKHEDDCDLADTAQLGPEVDGMIPVVRHTGDHQTQTGIARRLKEGQPLNGSRLIQVQRRPDGLYDFKELSPHEGPVMVNSKAFRDGWEGIFGQRAAVGSA